MPRQSQHHNPPIRQTSDTYTAITGATYTAKAGDRVIGVNRAGIVTVTLPTAQLRKGRIYTIKDESGAAASNNITVATEGSETIDGAATDVINVDYESKSYYSDGTNWFILPITPDTDTQLTLATTVSTQAHGDSAAGGSATTASKGDHKHAMPAAGGGTPPVFDKKTRTGGNLTTTSTTLEDITGMTITFTTGAFPVRYSIVVASKHSELAGIAQINVDVDGTLLHGTQGVVEIAPVANNFTNHSFSGQTAALTPASHTIKAQFRVGTGTMTLLADSNQNMMWSAEEIR